MSAKTIEEITAELENAAKGDSGKSESLADDAKETVEATAEETEKADTPKSKGRGASERIQELVKARDEATRRFEELQSKLSEKEAELGKVINMLEDREQDARVVAKMNELYQSDPRSRELLDEIDKKIRGIEVEQKKLERPQDAMPQPGQDLLRLQADLERTRAEAAAALADQKSDLLLMKADQVINEVFTQLPDSEYTADDLKVLQSALTDLVDWEGIEADPTSLESKVVEGIQKAVDWYGDPKGRIAAEASKATETTDATATKSKPVDLSKLELGKMKAETVGGKQVLKPVVSDNDFVAVLAEQIRRNNSKL